MSCTYWLFRRSSLAKCLSTPLPPFQWVVHFLLCFRNSLYILGIHLLSKISFSVWVWKGWEGGLVSLNHYWQNWQGGHSSSQSWQNGQPQYWLLSNQTHSWAWGGKGPYGPPGHQLATPKTCAALPIVAGLEAAPQNVTIHQNLPASPSSSVLEPSCVHPGSRVPILDSEGCDQLSGCLGGKTDSWELSALINISQVSPHTWIFSSFRCHCKWSCFLHFHVGLLGAGVEEHS